MDERTAGAMVFLSRDLDRTSLERAVRDGSLERLRRGAYGRRIEAEDRYARERIRARQHMNALARQLSGPFWFSHSSAAVLHDLPLLRPLTSTHLTQAQRPSGRADPTITRHTRPVTSGDTTVLDALPVTSLVRTALDCAMTMPDLDALTVLDRALATPGLADALGARLARVHGATGSARARWCVERADARAESPGETATRFTLLRHGLRVPALQIPVHTRHGEYRIDLGWPELNIGIEFDGKIKYTRMAAGDPAEVAFREKRRQDDLEREGWVIIRVLWADLYRPGEFIAEVLRRLDERTTGLFAALPDRWHPGGSLPGAMARYPCARASA